MKLNKFTEYANSFQAVARLELESIKKLVEFLGNPQDKLKFIHIAGTNGKGSVCSFLQNIFTSAGYRTGKYISPNLINVCERISVDGTEITEDELDVIMEKVKIAADKVKEVLGDTPTQFELWTAAAFLYFVEKKVDIVILETGLGGERDATNVVKNTLCSIITKISFDHISYLGNSLEEIARAKAGIIKENGITVYMPQNTDADNIIMNVAKEKNNKLIIPEKPSVKGVCDCFEIFDYKNLKDIKCGISGTFQPENAVLAIEAATALRIDDEYIKRGISLAKNPARFEVVSENPLIIFDGAHNPDGVSALCKSLDKYFENKRISFVTAVMADKDLKGEMEILKDYGYDKNSIFYTVTVKNNPRAQDGETLSRMYKEEGFSAEPCENIKEAVEKAKMSCDMVVIFGSLYLYKDFSEEIKDNL